MYNCTVYILANNVYSLNFSATGLIEVIPPVQLLGSSKNKFALGEQQHAFSVRFTGTFISCVRWCAHAGLTCLEAAQPVDTFVRAIFPSKFEHLCRQSVDIRDEERALTTCQLRRQVCTNFPTLRLGIFERHSLLSALRYEPHFVKCLQDLVHLSIKQLRRKVA